MFKTERKTAEENTMKRILVVDDDPSVLLGICRTLRGRRNEWEPVLALDTEEACMRLDAAPDIDVLVCDLTMPGEGGVKVLRHALTKNPHIARIVLSGHGRTDVAEQARELCHRFLDKPCPPQLLQDTIQWAIDRESAAGAASARRTQLWFGPARPVRIPPQVRAAASQHVEPR